MPSASTLPRTPSCARVFAASTRRSFHTPIPLISSAAFVVPSSSLVCPPPCAVQKGVVEAELASMEFDDQLKSTVVGLLGQMDKVVELCAKHQTVGCARALAEAA